MTLDEIQEMYTQAACDAMICGVGMVKITNTSSGLKFDRVPPEDFVKLADELKWTDSNTKKERNET